MNLLKDKLKEIIKDQKYFKSGRMDVEKAMVNLAFYNVIEKYMRMEERNNMRELKYGKKYSDPFSKFDSPPDEIEEEKVLCPVQDRHITRSECLDFSGNSENYESCKDCLTGLENKKLLLPETPLYQA